MRYSFVAAAIIGAVAATPVAEYGYPVNQPSSSEPAYPDSSHTSLGSSAAYPEYPVGTPSSSKSAVTSSSARFPEWPANSSVPCSQSYLVPSSSKGYSIPSASTGHSSSAPLYPTSTKELTTYTTTTVCPVTQTHGTQVVTTLTTSTVTITSCKGGCNGYETTSVFPEPTSSKPEDKTTVVTTYDWVPCSTEIGNRGSSKMYSTYLTASYKTYTSTIHGGQPPKTTATEGVGIPQYTPVASKDNKPSQPVGPKTITVDVGVPQYTPVLGQENCPAPVTVTKTVTVGVDVPWYTPVPSKDNVPTVEVGVPQYTPVPNEYTTKEGGKPQNYTITIPNGPKSTLSGSEVTPCLTSSHNQPTYPTSSGSSIVYSSSASTPCPTSSAGYHVVSSSAKPSWGAPMYEAYPIESSTKAAPTPIGGYNSNYGY